MSLTRRTPPTAPARPPEPRESAWAETALGLRELARLASHVARGAGKAAWPKIAKASRSAGAWAAWGALAWAALASPASPWFANELRVIPAWVIDQAASTPEDLERLGAAMADPGAMIPEPGAGRSPRPADGSAAALTDSEMETLLAALNAKLTRSYTHSAALWPGPGHSYASFSKRRQEEQAQEEARRSRLRQAIDEVHRAGFAIGPKGAPEAAAASARRPAIAQSAAESTLAWLASSTPALGWMGALAPESAARAKASPFERQRSAQAALHAALAAFTLGALALRLSSALARGGLRGLRGLGRERLSRLAAPQASLGPGIARGAALSGQAFDREAATAAPNSPALDEIRVEADPPSALGPHGPGDRPARPILKRPPAPFGDPHGPSN